MSLADIQSHNFNRHAKATRDIANALATLDQTLKADARNPQLQPGDRHRKGQEARSKAEQTIRQARAALGQAIADDRRAGRYADMPTGDALTRRAHWQATARADLEGLSPDQAAVVLRRVVDSGNLEAAAEYVRVSRPTLQGSQYAGEWKAAELDSMSREEKAHRVFTAGVDAVEAELPWVDRYTAGLLEAAGVMSEGARLGWEPAPALDTRQVTLWLDRAQEAAGVAAGRQLAVLDRREPTAGATASEGARGTADGAGA